jgi:hypothetical protein
MSRYTTSRLGSVEILTGSLNMNHLPIINVRTPESPGDVITKGYVDAQLSSLRIGKESPVQNAGDGLVLSEGILTVDTALTHLKQLESASGSFVTLNVSEKLTVPIDPSTPAEAVSKQYVDLAIQDNVSRFDDKLSTLVSKSDFETKVDDKLSNLVSNSYLEAKVDDKLSNLVSNSDLEAKVDAIVSSKLQNHQTRRFTPKSGDTIPTGNYSHIIIDPIDTLTSLNFEAPPAPQDGQILRIRTTYNIELINIQNFHTGVNQELPPSLDVDEVLHYIYVNETETWFRY